MTADPNSLDLRLSRRVRAAVRSAPPLLTEYRKQMKARRYSPLTVIAAILAALFGGVMMFIALPATLLWMAVTNLGVHFTLAICGLVATAAMLGFSEALLSMLRNSPQVTVSSHLPVDDADLANSIWGELATAFSLAAYFAAFPCGVVAFHQGLNGVGWTLALSLGVVHALVMIALGTILAVNRPRWSFGPLAGLLVVLAIGLIAGFAWLPPNNRPPLVAEVLYRATPGGWVNAVLGLGYLRGNVTAWFGLAAAGLIVALLFPAVKALKASYRIASFELVGNERATANIVGPLSRTDDDAAEADPKWSDAINKLDRLYMGRPETDDPDEMPNRIRNNGLLRPRAGKPLGPVERLVHRFLKPRERMIAEFLCAERSAWSSHLKAAALLVVLGAPVGLFLGWPSVLMLVAIGSGVACFFGPWHGVQRRNAGGTYLPMWTVFPLEYREMYRTVYKIGAIRGVLASVIATAGMAVPLVMMKFSLPVVLLSGLGWLAAVLVIQTWVVAGMLNAYAILPTFRWRRLLLYLPPILAVLCQMIAFALIAASFDFGPAFARVFAAGVGLTIIASIVIRNYYEWLHRSGRIDAVALNLSQTEETRLENAENIAELQIRQDLAREQHGRLWWRERALRRWVLDEE